MVLLLSCYFCGCLSLTFFKSICFGNCYSMNWICWCTEITLCFHYVLSFEEAKLLFPFKHTRYSPRFAMRSWASKLWESYDKQTVWKMKEDNLTLVHLPYSLPAKEDQMGLKRNNGNKYPSVPKLKDFQLFFKFQRVLSEVCLLWNWCSSCLQMFCSVCSPPQLPFNPNLPFLGQIL